MRKASRRKILVVVLSLGLLVLGTGCAAWALVNIWGQSYAPLRHFEKSAPLGHFEEGADAAIGMPLYATRPPVGDNIGILTIPALDRSLPIIEGTDAAELKLGVGHVVHSALPGEQDNCVLSGHRDTVFTRLGELKVGDKLIVQTSAGTFTYEIKGTRIVHKDDKTVIVPADHAVLTVTTCYPFSYIGSAPDRYIITADLVDKP